MVAHRISVVISRLNGGISDGSSPSEDVYLADPFVTESGSLTVFNTSDINMGISVEPQPTPAPAGYYRLTSQLLYLKTVSVDQVF